MVEYFSLPAIFSGLAIPIFHEIEYKNSMFLSELIKENSSVCLINDFQQQKGKMKSQRKKKEDQKIL